MDHLEIIPLAKPPSTVIRVPGSKSITNRALVLAALTSRGRACTLRGALQSEDTEVMIECLQRLGFYLKPRWSKGTVTVHSPKGTSLIPASQADLFVANSGTTMRFLTAVVSLGHGRYRLDGVPRMRERPIQDLLDALGQLGVRAYSERGDGCPPVVVEAQGLDGGMAVIKGDMSSQFLSAVLMAAPFARGDCTVGVQDDRLVSWPYVFMTVEMMRSFGTDLSVSGGTFHIPRQQPPGLPEFGIEPDASAASYFFGAAAITSGEVTIPDLSATSIQGDIRFVELLEQMGCQIIRRYCVPYDSLTAKGGPLRGIEADMNDISDTVMTLAAVACFAEGPTTIRNVAHIRHKETDRLAALATELRRIGARVEELADGLVIHPAPLHGAEIETYNDHRMAMSLALVGLRVPGIVIKNPGCVAKTYPEFFRYLEKLRQS